MSETVSLGGVALCHGCARSGCSVSPSGVAICGCRRWQGRILPLSSPCSGLDGWHLPSLTKPESSHLFSFLLLRPLRWLVFKYHRGWDRQLRGNVEDVGKGMLHLRYRIVFQDDDQLALLLRLLQTLRLAFVVILQRDYGVGITLVVGEDNGNAQLPCRLGEAVTVHAKGIDPQRLEKRRLLITILVFDRC